jgi:hypothetical protein
MQSFSLNFTSCDEESCNIPFTVDVLLISLEQSHNISAGPDSIYIRMLYHLSPPTNCLYNWIWKENTLPSSWREIIIFLSSNLGRTTYSQLVTGPYL